MTSAKLEVYKQYYSKNKTESWIMFFFINQYRYPGHEQFKINQGRLKKYSSFVLILRSDSHLPKQFVLFA